MAQQELKGTAKATVPNPGLFLKGNTLRAYLYFLRKTDQEVGIREMQKGLGFKTPSLAQYHIEKLRELGFISRTAFGNYTLVKETKLEILSPFVKFGSKIMPRLFMYLVIDLILLLYTVAFVLPSGNTDELKLWVVLLIGMSTLAFSYETIRSWKHLPF
jgi:hypothetical protein